MLARVAFALMAGMTAALVTGAFVYSSWTPTSYAIPVGVGLTVVFICAACMPYGDD